MFGQNPIRENESQLDGTTLAVQEIFHTLQGEGPFAGMPAVFIRLAGCNLACSFCDTEFESNIDNRLSVEAIMAQIKALPFCPLVVITGGEPLRQQLRPLVSALNRRFRFIQIETAGTLWQSDLEPFIIADRLIIVCSPKTPKLHPSVPLYCAHYKYIIEHGRNADGDGLPIYGTQTSNRVFAQTIARPPHQAGFDGQPVTVWVAPCDAHDADQTTKNIKEAVRIALKHNYRLSLQVHKLVGLP